jgi:hypothetical protein
MANTTKNQEKGKNATRNKAEQGIEKSIGIARENLDNMRALASKRY